MTKPRETLRKPIVRDDRDDLVSALGAIQAILGGSPGGHGEEELSAAERRLGAPLPEVLRAFHAVAGKDARLSRSSFGDRRILELAELRVEGGVLVVMDSSGEQWGVKLTDERRAPIVRSSDPREGNVGAGALLERASTEHPWRNNPRGLATMLRELAARQAIASMPCVLTGKIRLREAKQRIDASLERVGADIGLRTYVDRSLGVLVRYDSLMDGLTIGAPSVDLCDVLCARLSAQLRPSIIDGQRCTADGRPRAGVAAAKKKAATEASMKKAAAAPARKAGTRSAGVKAAKARKKKVAAKATNRG